MSRNLPADWFTHSLEGLPVCRTVAHANRARALVALLVVSLPLLSLLPPAFPVPPLLPAVPALAAAPLPTPTPTPLSPASVDLLVGRASGETFGPGDAFGIAFSLSCRVSPCSSTASANIDYTITGHVVDISPPPAPWDCQTLTVSATSVTGHCHVDTSVLPTGTSSTRVLRAFKIVDCSVTPITITTSGTITEGNQSFPAFPPNQQPTLYDCKATSAPTPTTAVAPTPTTAVAPTPTTAVAPTPTTPVGPTPTPSDPVGTVLSGGPTFITPLRVVDTRPSDPPAGITTTGFGPSGAALAPGRLADGATTSFCIGGKTFGAITVPADVTALLLNVTAIQGGPSGGFVTVYPIDAATRPNTSTLNPSSAVAFNFTTVRVPTTGGTAVAGCINVFSSGAARDLAIDLFGYYRASAPADRTGRQGVQPSTGNLKFVTPVRVLDTRGVSFGGPIGINADGTSVTPGLLTAGTIRRFRLAGQTFGAAGSNQVSFPNDVTGILAHVTTIQGAGSGGFVTLLPGDFAGTPTSSTLNPSTPIAFNTTAIGIPGGASANAGTFGLYSTQALDVAVDIVGFFAPSNPAAIGSLNVITPIRILDTRPTNVAQGVVTTGLQPNGTPITAALLGDPSTVRYLVAGGVFNGVRLPSDLKAVLVNVTVVQGGSTGGFVTIYPGDAASPPNASTVNPSTGIAASFWASGLPTGPIPNTGTLGVFSNGSPRDLLIDLVGYYR